jgi:hypothetical protein
MGANAHGQKSQLLTIPHPAKYQGPVGPKGVKPKAIQPKAIQPKAIQPKAAQPSLENQNFLLHPL